MGVLPYGQIPHPADSAGLVALLTPFKVSLRVLFDKAMMAFLIEEFFLVLTFMCYVDVDRVRQAAAADTFQVCEAQGASEQGW
jgi:hypothetical protein